MNWLDGKETEKSIKDKYKSENKVVSVWLEENPKKEMKMFHCFNCRYYVMKYTGDVVSIIAGVDKEARLPIETMCPGRNCRVKYHFHGILKR